MVFLPQTHPATAASPNASQRALLQRRQRCRHITSIRLQSYLISLWYHAEQQATFIASIKPLLIFQIPHYDAWLGDLVYITVVSQVTFRLDLACTDLAVEGLNGMELGDKHLKVQRASIGVTQAAGIEMGLNAMSTLAGTTSNDLEEGRVLQLSPLAA